jgi:cephalosporin hydroxylase
MLKDIIHNHPTDKFTSHSFLEVYEDCLPSLKSSALNVLEVGIQNGYSLSLWHDYFEQAHIFGADIIDLPNEFNITDRMTFLKGNAYDASFIQRNFSDKGILFDVLIDDGPHTLESMLFFARHYAPLLAAGGVLVIEDIPNINWTQSIISNLPHELKSKAAVVDLRHVKGRWDDILIVIKNQ